MGERWGHNEVISLLDLCIDNKVSEQMDGKKIRSAEIFKKIHAEMLSRNVTKTVEQIKLKFKKLKSQYISIKNEHNKSGGGKIHNQYWDKLEVLFANRPRCTYNEECGLESGQIAQTPQESSNSDAESTMETNSKSSERSRGGRNAYGKALNEAVEKWEESQRSLQTEYLKEQERLQLEQQKFEERMAQQDQEFLTNLFQSLVPTAQPSAPVYYIQGLHE